MTIVEDTIAELTAALTRDVDIPEGEFGFGTDLSCSTDLTPDCAEVDPFSADAVREANFRRLTTPRGSLLDDPFYGIDVASFLHEPMTLKRQAEIVGIITNELSKDDRNDPESLAVTLTVSGLRLLGIDARGQCAAGPFSLTIAIQNGEAMLRALNDA